MDTWKNLILSCKINLFVTFIFVEAKIYFAKYNKSWKKPQASCSIEQKCANSWCFPRQLIVNNDNKERPNEL